MNILQALDDPRLFKPEFGEASWAAWRTLLGGFYGLPESTVTSSAASPTGSRVAPGRSCGWRLAGVAVRSRAAALIAVYEAAFTDHRPKLSSGEVATVMVIAADRKQARTVHRYVRGLLNGNPMLQRMVVRETEEIIELSNRCVIEIGTAFSGAPGGTRSPAPSSTRSHFG